MQRLEVSGAVRPIYGSLGVKRLRWDGTSGLIFLVLLNTRTLLDWATVRVSHFNLRM